MSRAWVWFQLVIGWVPIWALIAAMMLAAHRDVRPLTAAVVSARMVIAGALLGPLVRRWVQSVPWPHPMRVTFVARHVLAAVAYSLAWFATNSLLESVLRWQTVIVVGNGVVPFLALGVWLYAMMAGVIYAAEASTRAAAAEVEASQAQLAVLRGQLNPHFLFNTLHTVVQLTRRAPERAARAAEDLAALLRTSLEEGRDLVPFDDEWRFVRRYLDLEAMRFGDRLVVQADIGDGVGDVLVPSFSLQTLVENAVRHGAAHRVGATAIAVRAHRDGDALDIRVHDGGDTGIRTALPDLAGVEGTGSGLRRLRGRLDAIYGRGHAVLELERVEAGVLAHMRVPARDT